MDTDHGGDGSDRAGVGRVLRDLAERGRRLRRARRLGVQVPERCVEESKRERVLERGVLRLGRAVALRLVDSRTAYETARYDRVVAELFLLATLGRLSPERFGVPAETVDLPVRLVPTMESWSLRLEKRD